MTAMVTPAPANQPIVAVQALSKTFKDFWLRTRAKAVDNVSFQVNRGEIFGLLGPNGSGKSTTIKVILGLLKQTSGRVSVFGKAPTDVATKKRIGYLPEESYLYPFLNARETLDYYAKLFQLDRRTRTKRIDDLLEMVGLSAVQHRAVREYSKGMQRRIGLAQALINDPDLLILDEPTTGLDPIGTRQVKDLIIELGRRGKTIILSSHLLADVEDCVHRMVILYGGKVQEEGTCDSLLTATDRAVIQTEPLDEQTIAAIDELIRARTGGRSGIQRVGKPRQSLEEHFVDLVNRAIAQKVETSGARHGGQTAEFLRAGPEDQGPVGEELIANLLKAEPTPAPDPTAAATPGGGESAGGKPASSVDEAAIGRLLEAAPAEPPAPRTPAPQASGGGSGGARPAPQQNVDLSLIGSLLDDTPKPPADAKAAKERGS
jgi:ABC-2 type transport system ATP-binding protein